MKKKFLVLIEKDGTNFSAYSPDLQGCIATGKSIEKTIQEMRSAMEFHLEGMIENNDNIPVPRSLNSYLLETDEIAPDNIITTIDTEVPELAPA